MLLPTIENINFRKQLNVYSIFVEHISYSIIINARDTMLLFARIVRAFTSAFKQPKNKKLELEAIWSETIFLEVGKARKSNLEIPLIDHLKNLKLPDTKQRYLKEQRFCSDQEITNAKQILMEAMDPLKGVRIQNNICQTQDRIKFATNQNQKLSFYPNLGVTSPIFKILTSKKQWQAKIMTLGRPGISKSMAYLFACHLASIITRYRCQCQEDAAILIQKQILRSWTPKIFYMSFKNVTTILEVAQLLQSQCSEFGKANIEKLFSIKDIDSSQIRKFVKFLTTIKSVYEKKGIKCLIIIDQINSLAKQYEKMNDLIIQKKKEDENSVTKLPSVLQEQNSVFEQQYKTTNQLWKIFEGFKKAKFYQMYNSSANIQDELLNQPQRGMYALNINYHEPLRYLKCGIQFSNLNLVDRKQILRFLWYEYARLQTLYRDKLQNIQDVFIKACDEAAAKCSIYSSFMTPLTIRKFYQDKQLPYLKEQKQIKTFIQNQCISINRDGLSYLKAKVKKFLQLSDPSTRQKKCLIYFLAEQYFSQHDSDTIPFGQLLMSSLDVLQHYDGDMFTEQTNGLKLIVQRAEFIAVAREVLKQKILIQKLTKYLLQLIKKNPATEGTIYEKLIIKRLRLNPKCVFKTGSRTFNQILFGNFISFTAKTTLSESLKDMYLQLRKQKSNIGQYGFAHQIKKQKITQQEQEVQNQSQQSLKIQASVQKQEDQNQSEHSQNSPSFDLMAISLEEKNKLNLVTFDFTLTASKYQIITKEKKQPPQKQAKLLKKQSKQKKAQKKIKELIQNYQNEKVDFQRFSSNPQYQKPIQQSFLNSIRKIVNNATKSKMNNIKTMTNKNYRQKCLDGLTKHLLKQTTKISREKLLIQRIIHTVKQIKNWSQTKDIVFEMIKNSKSIASEIRIQLQKLKNQRKQNPPFQIANWRHIIVCKKQHIQQLRPLIPSETIICGTKMSFDLDDLSQVNIQANNENSESTMCKILMESIKNKIN